MTAIRSNAAVAPSQNRRALLGHTAVLLLSISLTLSLSLGWNQIERLGIFGYPAVFVTSLLGSATIAVPGPSTVLIVLLGAALNPLLVGVVAGLGGAVGELTGYLAGLSGRAVLQDRPLFQRLGRCMERSCVLVIFLLAAVPNPFFDVGGIMAGALRMPTWHFLLASWLGKSLRFAILSLISVNLLH
jgi:membrane protein YqaA with SNARE-associated domain